jgi:hypothetical protein
MWQANLECRKSINAIGEFAYCFHEFNLNIIQSHDKIHNRINKKNYWEKFGELGKENAPLENLLC